jgi:hypothetical protein
MAMDRKMEDTLLITGVVDEAGSAPIDLWMTPVASV